MAIRIHDNRMLSLSRPFDGVFSQNWSMINQLRTMVFHTKISGSLVSPLYHCDSFDIANGCTGFIHKKIKQAQGHLD